MKGLTADRPKCLLPVRGRPLLELAIESLRAGGIEEIAIVTGYRNDLLTWPQFQRAFHNPDWETTNMVYSLARARSWLAESPCVVCYSDILFGAASIGKLARASGALVVANNVRWRTVWERRFANPLDDVETFRRETDGRLVEIGRRPTSLDEVHGQYMGLLAIRPTGWSAIESVIATFSPERFRTIDMTSLLQELIRRGERIDTVDMDDDWWEFDSEQDVERWR
jgi:choline kinase